MYLNDATPTDEDQLSWPQQPAGILIMGKRQGTKKENKQLWGRAALAAALWYSAPQPKPYLMFVAADVHGPGRTPDATAVKNVLVQRFEIPADYVILRPKSNCTLLEVRATRVLSRSFGLANIFAVTHLYHATRAQRYMNEVLRDTSVIPVHPDILDELVVPAEVEDLFADIRSIVHNSTPGRLDLVREQLIEWALGLAHTVDPVGRLERTLAKILRPGFHR
jgi:hypothetical protein